MSYYLINMWALIVEIILKYTKYTSLVPSPIPSFSMLHAEKREAIEILGILGLGTRLKYSYLVIFSKKASKVFIYLEAKGLMMLLPNLAGTVTLNACSMFIVA